MTDGSPEENHDGSNGPREQFEALLGDITDADDLDITNWDTNRETSTSGFTSRPGTAMEIGPTHHEIVGAADDMFFQFTIEMSDGKISATGPTDDEPGKYEEKILFLEAADDWDDEECPECGHPWPSGSESARHIGNDWEKTGGGGDAWGGVAIYDCPEDDCDGEVHVHY